MLFMNIRKNLKALIWVDTRTVPLILTAKFKWEIFYSEMSKAEELFNLYYPSTGTFGTVTDSYWPVWWGTPM